MSMRCGARLIYFKPLHSTSETHGRWMKPLQRLMLGDAQMVLGHGTAPRCPGTSLTSICWQRLNAGCAKSTARRCDVNTGRTEHSPKHKTVLHRSRGSRCSQVGVEGRSANRWTGGRFGKPSHLLCPGGYWDLHKGCASATAVDRSWCPETQEVAEHNHAIFSPQPMRTQAPGRLLRPGC
jgi:hypothetical protein